MSSANQFVDYVVFDLETSRIMRWNILVTIFDSHCCFLRKEESQAVKMASADPSMAQVTLKRGHSLRGRDVLPVVMRLSSLSLEDWAAKLETHPLASFTSKHALESYSSEELAAEFEKLTGYKILVGVKFLLL